MRRVGLRIARLALAAALAGALAAAPSRTLTQTPPASLLADSVSYEAETGRLTAVGNVEAYHEGRVLRARRIVYDSETDAIEVTGPMTLTDPEGRVFLADEAELTGDLSAGLIRGARLMIEGQLQLAANELRRTGDRFTTLTRTVASSCTVCAENPVPTWAVRAARVTQDAAARRIYFEDARVEFFGVPVAYLPQLSVPEPGVRRASGFLLPSIQQSNIYGFGFKLPYYRVLGPYGDATVTPFLTSKGAVLLEGEYRRRFARGRLDVGGIFALSDGQGDAGRAFGTANGAFRLRDGFIGDFDISRASDRSFLQQFDYSDEDRLTSFARVRRTRTVDDFELATFAFQDLREGQSARQFPLILPSFDYRRVGRAPGIGGRLGFDLDTLGVLREEGRDVLRGGGGADWRNDWILAYGVAAAATLDAQFDAYRVWNDAADPDETQARVVPGGSAELRWPLVRRTAAADHVIEPIAQIVYSDLIGDADVPNEDSQLPELDETNLFSLNRFPGRDRYETGLRANLGVSYTRYDPTGWSVGATVGRVVRPSAEDDFAEGTGLAGRYSDYVGSLAVDFDWGLSIVNRALFDDDLTFRRNEFAFGYDGLRGDVTAAYVFLSADDSDPLLGPQSETNEFLVDASYRVRPNWEVRGNWRYDVATNSPLRAGGGIAYGNECAEFDLSVSRRFTSSASVPPSTTVRFGLRLTGLGAAEELEWPERVCRLQGT